MKRIISLVLSLIMVSGICTSAPVSLVAYAADTYASYGGQLGAIIPVDSNLEKQVSEFDLTINNRSLYFMRKSTGCENACYSIELYEDAEYTQLARMMSSEYDTNAGSKPLAVALGKKDFSQGTTYYGKCYSYIDSDDGKIIDSDSIVCFTVNVIEHGILLIEFKPSGSLELIENYNGSWNSDTYYDEETGEEGTRKYFEYGIDRIVYQKGNVLTLNYKDGTSIDYVYRINSDESYAYCDSKGNRINIEYGSDQSYSNQWLPDNEYEFYVSYLGVKTFVPVYIKENPIKSVEWIKKPDKTEFMRREGFTLTGGVIRVIGKDGSVQDVTFDVPHEVDRGYYIEALGEYWKHPLSVYPGFRLETVGEYTEIIDIAGHQLTFDYTVTEFDLTDITIQLDENRNLDIIFKKSDGTIIHANYLDADFGLGDGDGNYGMHGGTMITDKGTFPGGITWYKNNGELSVFFYEDVEPSNRIMAKSDFDIYNNANWWIAVVGSMYGSTKSFNSRINENNISDIARMALCIDSCEYSGGFAISDPHSVTDFCNKYSTFSYSGDADIVENAIYKTFGIKVDLKDYNIYDEKTKTVTIENSFVEQTIKFPVSRKWIDGLWYINAESYEGEKIEIIVDEFSNIQSFKIGEGCKHQYSDWVVAEKATVYSPGEKHRECTKCGKILKSAKIPQLKCSKPKLKSIENTEYGVLTKWSKVSGADKYRVYRKTKKGDWKYLETTTKTYFTDKKAKSGAKYYYAVKARNEAGNSDLSKSLSKYYLADPTLKTPSSSKKGITLKWSKVSGAEGYIIYRKTGSGSYTKLKTEKGVSNLSCRDKSAKKGKTYTYKVKAYYSKTYSAYSNAKKIRDKY